MGWVLLSPPSSQVLEPLGEHVAVNADSGSGAAPLLPP